MLSNLPPRFQAPRMPIQTPITVARIVDGADQQDGRPHPVDDQVADRHAVAQRDAEVAGQRVLQERHELLRQRLVEPVGAVELLELLGRGEPAAAQRPGRVARHHPEQEEADHQHEGQAAQRPEAAAEHVPAVATCPAAPEPRSVRDVGELGCRREHVTRGRPRSPVGASARSRPRRPRAPAATPMPIIAPVPRPSSSSPPPPEPLEPAVARGRRPRRSRGRRSHRRRRPAAR